MAVFQLNKYQYKKQTFSNEAHILDSSIGVMYMEKKKSPKTLTSLRGYVESLPSCFMAKRVGNSLGLWGNCTPLGED